MYTCCAGGREKSIIGPDMGMNLLMRSATLGPIGSGGGGGGGGCGCRAGGGGGCGTTCGRCGSGCGGALRGSRTRAGRGRVGLSTCGGGGGGGGGGGAGCGTGAGTGACRTRLAGAFFCFFSFFFSFSFFSFFSFLGGLGRGLGRGEGRGRRTGSGDARWAEAFFLLRLRQQKHETTNKRTAPNTPKTIPVPCAPDMPDELSALAVRVFFQTANRRWPLRGVSWIAEAGDWAMLRLGCATKIAGIYGGRGSTQRARRQAARKVADR